MSASGFLCAARTSKGYGCINKATNGPLCPAHDPRNWCGAETVRGERCKRRAAPDGGPCSKHA